MDGLLLSQLPDPILTEEEDGRGTIRFWPAAANNREYGSCRANLGNMAGFELRNIAQARQVCELLRSLRTKPALLRSLGEEPRIPLAKGERLLWQGQPDRWRCMQKADRSRLPGAAWVVTLCGGFDLLILSLMGWQADMWFLHLILLGIAAVGVVVFLLPFRRSLKNLRETTYVLTDRRILRQSGSFQSEKVLDRGEETYIYMAQGRDGTATLMLAGLSKTPGGHEIFHDRSALMEGFQLLYIAKAAEVMDALEAVAAMHLRDHKAGIYPPGGESSSSNQ